MADEPALTPDDSATRQRVGVVISTLGRTEALERLLADLAAQELKPVAVAVCDQSAGAVGNERSADAVCSAYAEVLDIRLVRSPRGLSRGRNAAAAALGDDVDYLFFPNDTSRVEPDFFSSFRPGRADVVAAQYRDALGSRTRFGAETVPIDSKNAWLVLEPAMFIGRRAFESAGGFDTDLGSGADTPWQSGEGTDLLLRLAQGGAQVRFDPAMIVTGVAESDGLSRRERQRKFRAYGRGYGHILRVWKYGFRKRLAAVIGGFALGLRQPARFSLGDGWHVGLGRAEGAMNRILGRGWTAVDR